MVFQRHQSHPKCLETLAENTWPNMVSSLLAVLRYMSHGESYMERKILFLMFPMLSVSIKVIHNNNNILYVFL